MNRMLVVVFDDEGKAYEGRKALLELSAKGSIFVFASAVLAKSSDGTAAVKEQDDAPLGTLLGTSMGTLIGLLAGPVGTAIGALGGLTLGLMTDIDASRIGSDFIDDVRKALSPGKVALVADIDEEWTTPVDTRMEKLGGTVFRRRFSDVRDTANDEDAAAIKADIEQLKAEHAEAEAGRKAKLRDRLNELDARLRARVEKAKERRLAAQRAAQAKAELLKSRVTQGRAKP